MRSPLRALGTVLAAAVLVTAAAGCGGDDDRNDDGGTKSVAVTDTFTNPVLTGDHPDPQAIRAGDAWFLYTTNSPAENVPVQRSTDLVTWEPAGDAMPQLPAWADRGKTWAPEVIALAPDRFVLYPTMASSATGRQCIGRAVASSPTGPFVDAAAAPLVCQAAEGGSIDASPFRDADGTLYLTWKNDGNAIGQDTWLSVQRLAPDGLSLVGAPTRLLKQDAAWEGALIEAPFFWRHGDGLFLFYSANDYGSDAYAVGYATCKGPLGPCVKAPEPVLRSNDAAAGPGHCALVESGGRTWMLYHAWPPDAIGSTDPGRQVWLDEVTWDGDRPTVRGPTGDAQPRP